MRAAAPLARLASTGSAEAQAERDDGPTFHAARSAYARCTVARLMAKMGLRGATRGRAFKVTTVRDGSARLAASPTAVDPAARKLQVRTLIGLYGRERRVRR